MSDQEIYDAARDAGEPIGRAVGVFMLHPQTFAESIAAGYKNPLAAYAAGRGGVLGDVPGDAVSAAFVVFEPNGIAALWDEGVAVRGAAGAAELYWEQTANFGRKYLAGADGLDHFAALGEKIIAATPGGDLPLYAGWRAMPLVDDAAARALQVMFVLRELRAAEHFGVLTNSGISPVEANMLHGGPDYTAMLGWSAPFDDGADKKDRYAEVEDATNRRMAEIFAAALDPAEAGELARLSIDAMATLTANNQG